MNILYSHRITLSEHTFSSWTSLWVAILGSDSEPSNKPFSFGSCNTKLSKAHIRYSTAPVHSLEATNRSAGYSSIPLTNQNKPKTINL